MAKTPTELFDSLLKKANLSNKVSKQALIKANEAWQDYKQCTTALRDPHDLAEILAKLDIILNQVAWKETRIEPMAWHSFCQLHTTLATSLRTGEPLEPNDKPKKSANDEPILAKEIKRATAQYRKRTENKLKDVA